MPVYDSTKAFLRQQTANFKKASDANLIMRAASVEIVTLIQDRIQQQGQKSSGAQIGQYSDRIYKRARRKAKSFASKRRFAKTTSKQGYKTLRQKLGLQVAYIDLTFSGDMFKNWKAYPTRDGWQFGFRAKRQLKKADELENMFGQIFYPTKKEQDIIFRYITRQAQNVLKQ
jgi:hypothetical protein